MGNCYGRSSAGDDHDDQLIISSQQQQPRSSVDAVPSKPDQTSVADPPKTFHSIQIVSRDSIPPARTTPPRPLVSLPGTVLGNPLTDVRALYAFGRELGRGHFGITYLVTDRATGERCACKTIAKRRLTTPTEVEEVRREVQILHHLSGQENIVEMKGAYEDRFSVNVVMEVCEGGELLERIVDRGHYSERGAAGLCREMVRVVSVCHSLGVMHRDLKPENLLFADTSEGAPLKAADFGLSAF